MKKSIFRFVQTAIICAAVLSASFIFAGCICVEMYTNPEGTMGRYDPYNENEVLKILELEYEKEFTVLHSEDTGAQIKHTVSLDDIPEITFTFYDYSDGFAGWYAYDDFGDSVLLYCAEQNGFETLNNNAVCWYPVIALDGKNIESSAKDLQKTFDQYFKIFDYCRGKIQKYSSYNPSHEYRHTDFLIAEKIDDHIGNRNNAIIYSDDYHGYFPAMQFPCGSSAENTEDVLREYFDQF